MSRMLNLGDIFELVINSRVGLNVYAIKACHEVSLVYFSYCDGVLQKTEFQILPRVEKLVFETHNLYQQKLYQNDYLVSQ